MTRKFTPEQFAELYPREVASEPKPSKKVILSGPIIELIDVAANALSVLDSSLKEEQADRLPPLLDNLSKGNEITPASGQFSLILRQASGEDGTEVGELHIGIRMGPPALMILVRKALEASVQQPANPA